MALEQFQLPSLNSLLFFTPEYQERNRLRAERLNAQLAQLSAQFDEAYGLGDEAKLDALSERIWLTRRLFGVSGSVIGTISGQNKWQTPYSAWLEYTGRAQHDVKQTAPQEWGHRLEPVIAECYADKRGLAQRGAALVEQGTVCSNEFPFLLASVDRLVVDAQGNLERILEVKTAAANYDTDDLDDDGSTLKAWGKGNVYGPDGALVIQDSQVPQSYLLQVMLYMLVMKCPKADIAVLINTNDFRIFTIDYDPKLAQGIVTIADRFWCEHVLADVPPARQESDVKGIAPQEGARVEASAAVLEHISALKTIKGQLKQLKTEEQAHRDALLDFIGANERVFSQGKQVASYLAAKAPLTFDKDAFAAEHPDLFAQYQRRGNPYRRLVLSK